MTRGHLQSVAQIGTNRTTKGDAQVTLGRGESGGTSGIRRNKCWQSLSEDRAWTIGCRTKALTNLEVQLHLDIRPRQIGDGTRVMPMHARCRRPTYWALQRVLMRSQRNSELAVRLIKTEGLQLQDG